jgi:hypothetical protein
MRDAKDQVTFPEGWTAGGARSLTTWLSVVGDVDGQRKDIPALGGDIVLTSHAFTAGARAAAKLGPVKQFAQVTSGVLLLHGDAFGSGQTTTTWVIAPGLGLDYAVAKAWAARLEVDVRFVRTGQQVRAVAAIVYRR